MLSGKANIEQNIEVTCDKRVHLACNKHFGTVLCLSLDGFYSISISSREGILPTVHSVPLVLLIQTTSSNLMYLVFSKVDVLVFFMIG